jgi:hypothetical protein
MLKSLLKLSVFALFVIFSSAKADSSFMQGNTAQEGQTKSSTQVIPLLYIKDIEFYNHKTSPRYTLDIYNRLSFDPRVLVTEDKKMADYMVCPKLLISKIEPIDAENSRFSMSVVIELQQPDGDVVAKEQKNRYILIENIENTQKIAQKLIVKLLNEALDSLLAKVNML